MSKYLLGFPSIQVSSLFDKQRTLRLEMYLEAFLFWFQHARCRFNFCSVLRLLSMRANPHQPLVYAVSLGLLISDSAKTRVAGLLFFQPHKTHKQLSSSSLPALYHVVSKGGCVLAVGLQGNLRNTNWNGFSESFTESTFIWRAFHQLEVNALVGRALENAQDPFLFITALLWDLPRLLSSWVMYPFRSIWPTDTAAGAGWVGKPRASNGHHKHCPSDCFEGPTMSALRETHLLEHLKKKSRADLMTDHTDV